VTVEEDGVWLYANRDGLKTIAERIAALALADPADHPELHLKWHLGEHRSKRNPVFVLMDGKSRKLHSRARFEITFMAVEASDLKKMRRHEATGKLPRDWTRE
jgi:hypothetical protein